MIPIRPAFVPDLQLDLARLGKQPGLYRQVTSRFWEVAWGTDRETSTSLMDRMVDSLGVADSFFVSEEMCDLVEMGSENAPAEIALDETDLPCQRGFVVFERPIYTTDIHGKRMGFHAIMWSPAAIRERPELDADMLALPGSSLLEDGWGQRGTFLIFFDSPAVNDDYRGQVDALYGEKLQSKNWWFVTHSGPWVFGTTLDREAATGGHLLAYVFWTLSQQRIALKEEQHDKKVVKRALRSNTGHSGNVTVVRLRRPSGQRGEPGGSKDHDHRWIVSGHWRNQWYASLGRHKPVWIAAYVKGPDDAPVAIKKKVYAWTR